METPSSSIRRITRSQTMAPAAINSSAIQKFDESRQRGVTKQQDRSALIDITNDSPIVGLAMGKLETPSSLMSKKMVSINQGKQQQDMTPGSGEALLRCQVKNLLQKVEEEAEISKISSVVPIKPLLLHLGSQFMISPNGLLAPTPANTPQIIGGGNPSGIDGSDNNMGLDSIQESSQAESEELMVTRSLMLEFSEKSEGSYSSSSVDSSSVVTYQESQGKDKSGTEDDNSSIWSIQVNASSTKDVDEIEDDETTDVDDVEEEEEEEYYFDVEETEQENDDDDAGVDELCDAISKINVNGNGQAAKFCGKHTKFVYNSDDDEFEQEEIVSSSSSCSGGLILQGWPTPKGKHIRFPEEEEEESLAE